MKNKKIILISSFIIIILSLNAIHATTTNETSNYEKDLEKNTNNDMIAENNPLKQESNTVYVNIHSESDKEDGSFESPYKTINNENLEKISSNSKIYVSEGTYHLNPITFNKDISIIGKNKQEVIFIPNQTSTTFLIDKGFSVNFFNFTFENYVSDSDSAIINNGNLTIDNINFLNNTGTFKTSKKGNIFNTGNIVIKNSNFENNSASFGAALYNTGNATIYDSMFNTNHIFNVGGAIYSLQGNLEVYNSNFTQNAAVSGAAIYNAAGYTLINNTEFLKNNAEHFFGGAIYSTGVTILNNSVLNSNHANIDGGAITNTNNFTIINCSFIENDANSNGGAIENVPWSEKENGNLTIINSSFIENVAGNSGGVIINYGKEESVGEYATVTLRNSLFEANSARYGGIIYNEQYMDFQYNVFIDNDADEGGVIYSEENLIKSLDNNWWGTNNPSIENIGVMPEKWLVLNFTNTTPFITNFTTKLRVSLNTNNNGEIINSTIPARIALFSAEKTTFPKNNIELKDTIEITVKSLGDNITVSVNNQDLSLQPKQKLDVIVTYETINDVSVGDNITITGKFSDETGKNIANSNVKIFINSKKYYARTDNKGVYTFVTGVSDLGVNNVSVGYSGNSKYNEYSANTTFTVTKRDVIITYESIKDTKYGENVTISGTFMDKNGKTISNSNVKIFINSKKYYARTDNKGVYTLVMRVTDVGVNNVSVGYSGNSKYNEYSVNTTFTVTKQDVIVTYEEVKEVSIGENITLTGIFADKNGKAISNSNVKIIIGSNKYYAKTDNKGVYTFTTKVTSKTFSNIILGYSGSLKYNEYFTNVTISIKE